MATTKPPAGERGSTSGLSSRAVSPFGWNSLAVDIHAIDIPEMTWPLSLKPLREMLDQDAQIQALYLGITMPVRSQWRLVLEPGDLDPTLAQSLADDLDVALTGQEDPPGGRRTGRVSMRRLRASSLRALGLGHALYEQVWEIENGQVRLRKLAPRPQHTIQEWTADRNGEWNGVQQGWGFPPTTIPRDKLLAYTWGDDTDGNPRGRSILRALYKHWLVKDRLMRIDVMSHSRHGTGWFKGQVTDARGQGARDELNAIGQAIEAGQDSTVIFPEGTDGAMMGLTGSTTQPIESVRYHDEQMARALLGMVLQLGQTQTGSRALGEVHMDLLGMFHATVAQWEADTLTEQVVERWTAYNVGEGEVGARLVAQRVNDSPPSVDELTSLIASGAIRADDQLEAWLRAQQNLPDAEPATVRDSTGTTIGEQQTLPLDDTGADFADGDTPMPDLELRREPSDAERRARVDPKALDQAHDAVEADVLADLAEVRAALKAAALNALRDELGLDSGPVEAGIRDSNLARRLADRIRSAVPDNAAGRLIRRLVDAAVKGEGNVTAAAERQGATIQAAQVDHEPMAEQVAAELVEAVVQDVAVAVATEAQRLTPAVPMDQPADSISVPASPDVPELAPEAAEAVVEQVAQTVPDEPTLAQKADAAGAASEALFAGEVATMRENEQAIDELYAMELLDARACEPCLEVDGREYDTLDDALEDYPTGKYKRCEGRKRCRGRVVAIFA